MWNRGPVPPGARTQGESVADNLNAKRKDLEKTVKCYAKKKSKRGMIFNSVACWYRWFGFDTRTVEEGTYQSSFEEKGNSKFWRISWVHQTVSRARSNPKSSNWKTMSPRRKF
jgi:hypothetical protein